VIDCTDNIKTRYLLSDYCVIHNKRFIAGSVLRFEGQIFTDLCYRCLFPKIKEVTLNCDEAGVSAPMCGVIGSILADECVKMIIKKSEPSFLVFDGMSNTFNKFDVKRKNNCHVCINKDLPEEEGVMKGNAPKMVRIDPKYKISWSDALSDKNIVLVDVRNEIKYEMVHIKDSINIPCDKINGDLIKGMKKKVALICDKGISAGRVCEKLINEGANVFVVDGGLRKYKNEIDGSFPLDF